MIEINISRTLGRFHLNMEVKSDSRRIGILGASGCGKSMTLGCIAGIESPDRGRIVLNGRVLFDSEAGPLTPEEFDEIKKHTLIGEELMRGMKEMESEPLVEAAAEICRWHHERVDGSGYPDGLKGDEIPMTVQAVGLADAYDALVSQRVYKPAYTHAEALAMIRGGECGAFDPLLVDCLEDIQGALCREVYGMRGKE